MRAGEAERERSRRRRGGWGTRENGRLYRMMRMQIGAAPIVLTVFSLVALALPLPVRKCKAEDVENEPSGDQPDDTASAPAAPAATDAAN